jgi:hypothetical protein
MADNKGYISNKDKKKQEFEEQKKKQYSYRNPSKTLAGKICIIILVLAMVIGPIIFLIYHFATQ